MNLNITNKQNLLQYFQIDCEKVYIAAPLKKLEEYEKNYYVYD